MAAPLHSLTFEGLSRALGGTGRAQEVLACLRKGEDPFLPDVLPEKSRARLQSACAPSGVHALEKTASSDGTVKFLLGLSDGRKVESVLIPTDRRSTLCISSQVGCARGCTFCLTARMGLVRPLTGSEIVAQVVHGLGEVRRENLPALRNVVFMGMGEPLDNLPNVQRAIEVMTDVRGMGIPGRFITVSTVGPSPEQILKTAELPSLLAWSLHAADDGLRKTLVPTTKFSVAELRDAFGEVLARTGKTLLVELTLIEGVNDDLEAAQKACELLRPLPGPIRVNLLPMNSIGTEAHGSAPSRVAAFQDEVRKQGLLCFVRRTRGAAENAACGQLAVARV